MIFAEILFAHHVVFWADRTSVSLTITDAKAFLGVLSYVVHHFICVDFGCFILNCEMIYYICTFIAATHTHPLSRLSLLARARHYTSILLRHLSNASACHLFAYFFSVCFIYSFSSRTFLPRNNQDMCAMCGGFWTCKPNSFLTVCGMSECRGRRQTRTTSFTVDFEEHIQFHSQRLTKFQSVRSSVSHSLTYYPLCASSDRDAFRRITNDE